MMRETNVKTTATTNDAVAMVFSRIRLPECMRIGLQVNGVTEQRQLSARVAVIAVVNDRTDDFEREGCV